MFVPYEASTTKPSRKPKPVQYRPRHKRLDHLEEEVTKHGFEQRLKIPGSHTQSAEPVYCSVWGMNEGGTSEIEINSRNYRAALDQLGDSIGLRDRRFPQKNPPTSYADNAPDYSRFEPNIQHNGLVASHTRPHSTLPSPTQAMNYHPTPTAAGNLDLSRLRETASNYSGYDINPEYSTDRQALYQYPMTPEIPETEEEFTETELEQYINSASQVADESSRQEWVLYQHQAETVMWDQAYQGSPAGPRAGVQAEAEDLLRNNAQYTGNTHSRSFNPYLERYSNQQERHQFP